MAGRRARDLELLDALDAHTGVSYEGDAWRIVRDGRDVLQGFPSAARWDPGTFDVVYMSLERDGALAEIHFHLSRQPVFPSKIRFVLHRIAVKTKRTLKLADLEALARLGVAAKTFGELDYQRMQDIGDAAHFLGFDGLLAPSARWNCPNLVLFRDRLGPNDLTAGEAEPADWIAWRERHARLRRS